MAVEGSSAWPGPAWLIFGILVTMKPQHHLDEGVAHSDEEAPHTVYFKAWYVDDEENLFEGEATTQAAAQEALRKELEQRGIDFSSLPPAMKHHICL